MMRRASIAALAIIAGCAKDETAILLTVCSNVLPPEVDRLQLRVVAGDSSEEPLRNYDLPGQVDLQSGPLELSLRPGTSINGAIEIRASLLRGPNAIVTRRILTAFREGEDRDVRILLDGSCVDVPCSGELTCDKGSCAPLGPGNDTCREGSGGRDAGADAAEVCDADGDQYEATSCGGDDCNDREWAMHPDAAEVCDQIDNDCSGEADDGLWVVSSERYASYATTDEQAPSLAWGANFYGSAWRATKNCTTSEDCGAGETCFDNDCGVNELRFVRQEPQGSTPATADQTVLSGALPFVGEPMLAWTGTEWGVVYEDVADGALGIFFRQIDSDGLGLDFPVLISVGDEGSYAPAIAWTGSSWGAVWSELEGGSTAIQFARMDFDGFVRGGGSLTQAEEDAYSAALDWGDGLFGVAWIEASSAWFQAVSEDGVPQMEPVLASDGQSPVGWTVDVAWAGDGFALVWDQVEGGVAQLFFAKVSSDGALDVETRQIAYTGHRSVTPDLVYTGRELAVVWADGNEGDAQILLQRLTVDGDPIGGPARMIGNDTARGSRPALSWNEDYFEYGVVWQDQRLTNDTDVWFNRYLCIDGTTE
ncbi:MAG: putative metal-binding motif-containing protein [Deltaproteobacteria bacterium]|nr:putative metal-binding motif-containing protein [Deltaproteobacteria bacterium]